MKKHWWKEGVIYQIYPRSFNDSNGDGIGDLRGIIQKVDYLHDLGVDIIWLSPIFSSPNDDNGYDISDYRNIMMEFGTMDDFDELLRALHDKGMKLLMDLVVNHTSDEHDWFEKSRASKDNEYRDYYFWKPGKDGGPPNNWKSFFGGSAWQLDEKTGEYYLHLFTKKQPDLNWENPKVRQEVHEVVKFWLDKGVDGFRLDVISLISKRIEFVDADFSNFNAAVEEVYANGPRIHEYLQDLNKKVISNYDVLTVGEGPGITTEHGNLYVGKDRGELNMIFHFGHMFMDHGDNGRLSPVKKRTLADFKKVFREWDEATGDNGWINIFLDNHDFPRAVSRWGNDKKYRIASAKLLANILLTLRGTPCIYQGTEIGMTNVAFNNIEDYRDVETHNFYKEWMEQGKSHDKFMKLVHIQGRDNVRTPMQWDASLNAGFTIGTPWIKLNPNYERINVAANINKRKSIYAHYQKMLLYRKEHPTLIYGKYKEIGHDHAHFFSYYRYDENGLYFVIHNMSEKSFRIPKMNALKKLQLDISNYKVMPGDRLRLRPWESRVYRDASGKY